MPASMQKQTITNEGAMALIVASEAKAREIGVPPCAPPSWMPKAT